MGIAGAHVDTNESEDANVFVFVTHLTPPSGGGSFTVGIAWRGTLCTPDDANVNGGTNNGKGFRISINSWVFSDLGLAETITHEMGHNLNMRHDFIDPTPGTTRTCDTDGSSCTDIGGVMDYFGTVNKWTCCSNADFLELYNQYGSDFCLQPCEDDGGNSGDGGSGSCEDTGSAKKCAKCNKKKCKKSQYCKEKCKDTCNLCDGDNGGSGDCEDKWPQKKCNKKCNAKKCKKSKGCQKNCKDTCGLCDERVLPFF